MNERHYQSLCSENPEALIPLLVEKDLEIEKLRNIIVNAQKHQYGSKSEKLATNNQEQLFPVDTLVPAPTQEELITVEEHTRPARRTQREIPKGTVVTRIEHPPTETTCSCCGEQLHRIREEITKILNYVPARFTLEEHVRPVMGCKHCRESAPQGTVLPAGIQVIPRSPAGVGLLSTIIIAKYQDHLPLYRQEAMFARLGYELKRKTMCEWLGHCAELLHPLYKVLKEEVLREPYLQGDETTVKVQDEELSNRCHTGYYWGLSPPQKKLVYFHYADTRASEVPKILLEGYKGVLQTDLYAGYNQVYLSKDTVRAGCFAHVRRKFIEVQKLAQRDAGVVLALIAKLYQVESKERTPEKVLALRQKRSVPILQELHEYLISWAARTLPRSEVQKAIQYALSQWEALTLFVGNPLIELDNNLIENQMRPIALGRKNWLFAGSHEGAMRAALFFSIINSCRMNKVNTWHYFNALLPALATKPSREQLVALLPHVWGKKDT